MNSFERFNEENLSARKYFYSCRKDGKIDDDCKISDGHISVKDYLTCEKILEKFEMENMGDYHNHYLKKDVLLLADVFETFIATCLKFSAMRCQLKLMRCQLMKKSPIGYFLEFDLEYSDKLHELHNDYPLAPEKLAISSGMLSNY